MRFLSYWPTAVAYLPGRPARMAPRQNVLKRPAGAGEVVRSEFSTARISTDGDRFFRNIAGACAMGRLSDSRYPENARRQGNPERAAPTNTGRQAEPHRNLASHAWRI